MTRSCLPPVLLAALCAHSAAQLTPNQDKPFFLPVNLPATDADPVMDGKATDAPEWADGMRLPDSFFFGDAGRSGFYWFERKEDWNAIPPATLSADGLGITYPGMTVFVAHDIVGSADPENPLHQFQLDEDRDWNSFDFPVSTGMAKIWVFDGVNDADDSDWLPFSEGLDESSLIPEGTAPDLIDDRGFIARLNDDPSTDVHWFEGDPEPGDAGWDWEAHHFVFGRRTFGQSFQDVGLDPDPENAVDHEVYEACSYRPDFDGDDPPPFCLWWELTEEEEVEIKDVLVMKDGTPTKAKVKVTTKKTVPILKGQWWLHWWDDQVFGIGVPNVTTLVTLLGTEMNAAAQGAPEAAQQDIQFAISFLGSFLFLLDAQQYDDAFQVLKFARIHQGRAEKKGLPKLAWLHARVHAISIAYYILVLQFMQLDAFGPAAQADGDDNIPITDKELGKVSRAFYAFGKGLQAQAAKGAKGQGKLLNQLNKLKKATKALEKLQDGP